MWHIHGALVVLLSYLQHYCEYHLDLKPFDLGILRSEVQKWTFYLGSYVAFPSTASSVQLNLEEDMRCPAFLSYAFPVFKRKCLTNKWPGLVLYLLYQFTRREYSSLFVCYGISDNRLFVFMIDYRIWDYNRSIFDYNRSSGHH